MVTRTRQRLGFTLIELIVVLTILGAMSGIVVGWASRGDTTAGSPAPSPAHADIEQAVRRASREGRAITLVIVHEGRSRSLTALPGGRVVGGRPVGVDPLTGEWLR